MLIKIFTINNNNNNNNNIRLIKTVTVNKRYLPFMKVFTVNG